MRALKTILTAFVAILLSLTVIVFYRVHQVSIEKVTDDLHVLYGLGGNVGVLATSEGSVIIDTMTLQYQGSRIREIAEDITGSPVTMIINTHYHLDHTHGNPAFAPGTRVISTARTLHHLEQTDADYFSGANAALMPNETFDGAIDLTIGNKTIRLMHPGRGHTDGDLVALMVEEESIHMGDLFFNKHYPNIDLEAGGSVQKWGDTLDEVLKLQFTHVIPGHGPVSDRDGIRQFQEFIRQLADIGARASTAGISLEATRQSTELTADAGYSEITMVVPIGLDREFVLQRAWEETHHAFTLRP